MNENKKYIEELEQELAILDHKRIEIASKIFSLNLKEAIVEKILELKKEDDDSMLDIDITDITS